MLPALALAAAPLGCSSAPEPTRMSETIPCAPLDATRYASLTPAPGIDGIAFFMSPSYGNDGARTSRIGTLCATARDRARCLAQVDTTQTTEGWTVSRLNDIATESTDHGVVTAGDEVRLIVTFDELRAAVAPVEGLSEAAAFARVNGVNFACDEPNARVDDDGVLFLVIDRSCGGVVEGLTKLTHDGRLTHSERVLHPKDDECVTGASAE
jgi:hypothetical protein